MWPEYLWHTSSHYKQYWNSPSLPLLNHLIWGSILLFPNSTYRTVSKYTALLTLSPFLCLRVLRLCYCVSPRTTWHTPAVLLSLPGGSSSPQEATLQGGFRWAASSRDLNHPITTWPFWNLKVTSQFQLLWNWSAELSTPNGASFLKRWEPAGDLVFGFSELSVSYHILADITPVLMLLLLSYPPILLGSWLL